MRSPVPLDMPGQRKSSPFWVEGAVPGVKVVTEEMMVEVVGPRERAPPQLSRLLRAAALAVARRAGRRAVNDSMVTTDGTNKG